MSSFLFSNDKRNFIDSLYLRVCRLEAIIQIKNEIKLWTSAIEISFNANVIDE